ncbi:p40/c42 [Oxyplax ochracea nucleopolyhedrovirus]|uniref:p40/c42 n=1 Tax=Oxyplax ochracea nucleopolyhedrovirus TaxID=2083176 RepID=A0A2L0WU18_9ABAC|nr:p40/c42 [Oxyplax ochracea nucleopolyhedrovirus]AVA31141.1 p40/c42 [Oxyplax ochracea nucleopolyhedrovirus]
MSATALFLEINKLRLKIDETMQLIIWPQLFPLLCDQNQTVEINTDTILEFLMLVARASQNTIMNNNAAIASQYASGNVPLSTTAPPTVPTTSTPRTMFNMFQQQTRNNVASANSENLIDMKRYKAAARKLVQYYALNNTHSAEHKIGDIVMTMIFLLRSEKYNLLFKLLESTINGNMCRPQMTQLQVDEILDALRSLMEMPSATVDLNTVDILRASFTTCFNSPIMRYAKIVLLDRIMLHGDKCTTFDDLLYERLKKIQTLQPQQYIKSGTEIPFCDDVQFLDKLLKHIDPYPLPRMFYNAANTIFYTTMENYAIANCEFKKDDYNKIFKVLNNIKKKDTECSDELNIYLGTKSLSSS